MRFNDKLVLNKYLINLSRISEGFSKTPDDDNVGNLKALLIFFPFLALFTDSLYFQSIVISNNNIKLILYKVGDINET